MTYTLSPTSLVEFRMGYTKSTGGKWPIQLGTPNMLDAYGIPGLPTDASVERRPEYAGDRRIPEPGTAQQHAAVPESDGAQSEGELHAHVRPAFAETGLRVSAHRHRQFSISVRSTGRTATAANSAHPPAPRRTTFTTLPTFCSGRGAPISSPMCSLAQYRQRMNFFYVQDDWKVSGN